MRCASQDDELTLLVGRWEGEPGVAHPLSPCGNAGHDDAVARHTVHRQRLQYDVVRVRGSGRAGPSGGAHAQKHHLGGLKGMEGDMRVPVAFRRGIHRQHYLGGVEGVESDKSEMQDDAVLAAGGAHTQQHLLGKGNWRGGTTGPST